MNLKEAKKAKKTEAPSEPKEHPGGVCSCFHKHQRIERVYLGFGFCAYCGNLTKYRVGRRAAS